MNKKSEEFWAGAVFLVAVFILIILTAGNPDLLDAIIKHISSCN